MVCYQGTCIYFIVIEVGVNFVQKSMVKRFNSDETTANKMQQENIRKKHEAISSIIGSKKISLPDQQNDICLLYGSKILHALLRVRCHPKVKPAINVQIRKSVIVFDKMIVNELDEDHYDMHIR